ncbi:hypothetical protein [Propionispira raffinosivorans]|uniref:hypothetical protein n=1 Tax=Propionispira raffinosivorans TaxID=86959 RepID=UPI000371E6B2|nr:hypothetical protein [Propionispira raffinosivorans]
MGNKSLKTPKEIDLALFETVEKLTDSNTSQPWRKLFHRKIADEAKRSTKSLTLNLRAVST